MPTYFIPFQYTGVIGIISAILGGLYTYGISLVFNFAIQHSKQSDLRLRIANTYGIFDLVREIANTGKRPHRNKAAVLCTILFLTLAGKSLSFIVTTGIKASTGIQLGVLETVETRFSSPSLEMANRGDSRSILQAIYDFQTKSVGNTVNFEVLANSTPIRVAEVGTSNTGGRQTYFGPKTRGAFSFVRQTYRFEEPEVVCEPTSHCNLRIVNTTLSGLSSPATMLDAPFSVWYMNAENNDFSTPFQAEPPVRVGAQIIIDAHSEYLAERPYTVIQSYTDVDGTSVYAAITTASFQLTVPETSKRFANVAQQLIGSSNPLYPAIFTALNASMHSNRAALTNTRAFVVFNNPTAATNNLTHVLCVGHQGTYFGSNHNPSQPEAMISCRETRITVMANKDFKAKVEPEDPPPATSNPTETVDPDDPRAGYQDGIEFPYGSATVVLTMYNSQAPTFMTMGDIVIGNLTIDSLDEIDRDMPALLKDIADRVAPLNAEFVAKVVPYKVVPGIQVELWAIIFIAIVVLIVVVLFALDRFMNDAASRASVTTLIEHSTMREELLAKGKTKDWAETDYSPWALVKEGDTYQITLRREIIGVQSEETKKLRYG
ncbi:hypothetical protein BGZ75_006198 [Mortierella antarctica]|nr:hypothetical protein BGZ75_006198 [Mortierella antarctica]